MIITDRFVYVHEPKTGGTFVTSVLLRVHGIEWTRLTQLLTVLRSENRWRGPFGDFVYQNNKHGTCNQVPPRYRDHLATIRHPLDLYASEYEFGWWKRRGMLRYYRAIPDFATRFPTFPDLRFEEYVALANLAFRSPRERTRPDAPGAMTERFVRYYCRDPLAVMQRLNEPQGSAEDVRRDLHDITFLRTNGLNRQLHAFLGRMGYPDDVLAFIPTLGRVLPQGKGRPMDRPWQSYYSPELLQSVRESESVLFDLFPDFDT